MDSDDKNVQRDSDQDNICRDIFNCGVNNLSLKIKANRIARIDATDGNPT